MTRLRARRLLAAAAAALVLVLSACGKRSGPVLIEPPDEVYVLDRADLLSADAERYVLSRGRALDRACGAQIAVLTVDFLDGMSIQDFAARVFSDWGIGDAEKDNGVLLLFAAGERQYWALQGSGIEADLTAGTLGALLREHCETPFLEERYDDAVVDTYAALVRWFETYYGINAAGIDVSSGPVVVGPDDPDGGLFGSGGFFSRGGTVWGKLLRIVIALAVLGVVMHLMGRLGGALFRGTTRSAGRAVSRGVRRGMRAAGRTGSFRGAGGAGGSGSSGSSRSSFGGGGSRGGGAGR